MAKNKNQEKEHRKDLANNIIKIIAAHGRGFFYHKGNISRFEILNGRVWFHDGYSNKKIYTHYTGRWNGFTEGGTLRSVVIMLRDYIQGKKDINLRYFGPWSKVYCDGDLWGYGSDMETVRDQISKCVFTEVL
jgi:hypothetical protein